MSGNAHQRRIIRKAIEAWQRKSNSANTQTLTKWLRGTGAGSLMLGGVGMTGTWFIPSICMVYAGFAIFTVDVLVERFRQPAVKAVLLFLLLLGCTTFTWLIVLHQDPVMVTYMPYVPNSENTSGILEVFIDNSTGTDLRDFDADLILPQNSFVVGATQPSLLASCTLFDLPTGSARPGEQMTWLAQADGQSRELYLGNFQRVRCETLPHQSVLHLLIAVSLVVNNHLEAPRYGPSDVRFKGSYRGKFRTFEVNKPATFSTGGTKFHGWKQQ